jgi:nucleotide-binding universal stress UspA family protein
MWQHAVVPVDGREPSLAALQAALALQTAHGTQVDALYIIEVPRALPVTADMPAEQAQADQVEAKVQQVAKGLGGTVRFRRIQARALGAAILAACADADLLVVAGRGANRFNTPWGENLATFLIRKAPCAVFLYRSPLEDE